MTRWLMLALALSTSMAGCGGGGDDDACNGGVVPDPGCSCVYPKKNPGSAVCTLPLDVAERPETKRAQCGDLKEFCAKDATTAPKLGCLTAAPAQEPATPDKVTLTGWVDVFSSGPDSNDVTIQIFDAAQLDAAASIDAVTPIGETTVKLDAASFPKARFCPNPTSDLGRTDATCRPQTADCAACPEGASVNGTRYCLNSTCEERLRAEVRFEIPNIPTRKFLAIRTMGPGKTTDPLWGVLVQYNVYLSTAARACTAAKGTDPLDTECLRMAGTAGPEFEKNVNVLSKSDYMTIPTTIGTAITPGFGAIAGEVRDCEDVRLEAAQVGYDMNPGVRSYSNGNPNKTVFDLGMDGVGTSRLGIFTGINMAPGVVTVEGWGKVGGAATLLGKYRAKVWPDTVSTITINGGRPPQP